MVWSLYPTGYFFALRGRAFLLPFHAVLIGRYLSLPQQGADRGGFARCLPLGQGAEPLPVFVRDSELEPLALCEHDTLLRYFKAKSHQQRHRDHPAYTLSGG